MATWVRRKIKWKVYKFKMNFNDSSRSEELQAIKRDKEKYSLLKPKLEVIAERLDKLRGKDLPQDNKGSKLSRNKSILFTNQGGDILFDANAFFDVLDKNGDGVLSFEEINTILCLNQEQLELFIENMRKRSTVRSSTDNQVLRATFERGFLAALAEASQLGPTAEEVADLFDSISEGEELIQYSKLYHSSLSSFLSDLQIYGLVTRFRSKKITTSRRKYSVRRLSVTQESEGISREFFIEFYPVFLSEVIHEELGAQKDGIDGLDVTFDDLTLTVSVGKLEKKVLNGVNGRLRSNTMTGKA